MDVTRNVLCIHGAPCDADVLRVLEAAGWSVHDYFSAASDRGRQRECRVGAVFIPGDEPSWLDDLEANASRWRYLELIAIVSREALHNSRVRHFIAACCSDYQTLPIEPRRLLFALGHASGMAALTDSERTIDTTAIDGALMVGKSAVMGRVRTDLAKVARVDAPVMITGGSGTGKELAARSVHAQSKRHANPFVAVNCVSLPPTLIHAELFGSEKGAYTGAHKRTIGHLEAANHGSIFLDEIGDLDLENQAVLLRFLEEKTVRRVGGRDEIELDVRVITATHVDLEEAVKAGRFREDLYYRINVLRVHLPLLRDRKADIEALANLYLTRYAAEHRERLRGFTASAVSAMECHPWPGNVRELINRVRRAIVMSDGHFITAEDLRLFEGRQVSGPRSLDDARREAERLTLIAALSQSGWQVTRAAELIGVSRATFYRLASRHSLSIDEAGQRPEADWPGPEAWPSDPPKSRHPN